MTSGGALRADSIPFDDRIVVIVASSTGEKLTEEEQAIFDSVKFTDHVDPIILERSNVIAGLSQDDAMDRMAEDGVIPAKSSSSSTSTGSGSSSTSTHYDESGDAWFETEDGDVLQFDDNGSVTQYNDLGVTTFNSDGTKEWTDGWGTVVRDTDGDGEPDIVSRDSGETWEEL